MRITYGVFSSTVEHWSVDPKVVGSNPSTPPPPTHTHNPTNEIKS